MLVSGARLVPILTTGDILPGSSLPWAPVPDGLGAYRDGTGIVVFANHEITASGVTSSNGGPAFRFSRVSRLQLDPSSLNIMNGEYAEDGSGGYIRFCSATWADAKENLPTGFFLSGEENGATAKGSVVLATSGRDRRLSCRNSAPSVTRTPCRCLVTRRRGAGHGRLAGTVGALSLRGGGRGRLPER